MPSTRTIVRRDDPTIAHSLDFETCRVGNSRLIQGDCLDWFDRIGTGAIHAIVTDPPYGVKEYDPDQLRKRASGKGGVWRIPPAFDGSARQPLPRFTALDRAERERLRGYFFEWGKRAARALRPGGHVFLASNAFVSQLVFGALIEGGLEFRGEIIRLVRTLRGGDRPKNAETEFSGVCSMAKGCYEPWGVFRNPLEPGMRVSDCLRIHNTGGLRRYQNGKPFEDVIQSERTPRRERDIADHPSLKPQSLLRRLVYAALSMGEGIVADPFMGSGSTIAAAEAVGVTGVGVERHPEYYRLATQSVKKLASLHIPETDPLVGAHAAGLLFQSGDAR